MLREGRKLLDRMASDRKDRLGSSILKPVQVTFVRATFRIGTSPTV
jgi:hypothetical protein